MTTLPPPSSLASRGTTTQPPPLYLQLVLCIRPDGWSEIREEFPRDKRAQRDRLSRLYCYARTFEPQVEIQSNGDAELILYETRQLTRDSVLFLDAQQWMNQQSNDSYVPTTQYSLTLRWR